LEAPRYTRSRRPVTLVYEEGQPDRSSALEREAGLRRLGRAGKLALIATRRSLRARGDVHDPVCVDRQPRLLKTDTGVSGVWGSSAGGSSIGGSGSGGFK